MNFKKKAETLFKKILKNDFFLFALIGGVGFLIELAIFNIWRLAIPNGGPLIANTVATTIVVIFNYIFNKKFTFTQANSEKKKHHEFMQFIAATLSGLILANLILWFSHYVLAYDTLFADNIAKVFGLVFGSVSKYVLYKYWVFKK